MVNENSVRVFSHVFQHLGMAIAEKSVPVLLRQAKRPLIADAAMAEFAAQIVKRIAGAKEQGRWHKVVFARKKASNGILMGFGCPKRHKPDWLCVFSLGGNSHREKEAGMGFGLSAVRHL